MNIVEYQTHLRQPFVLINNATLTADENHNTFKLTQHSEQHGVEISVKG